MIGAVLPCRRLVGCVTVVIGRIECPSPTGENRPEAGLRENALHLFAFVALDFDTSIFHRASDTAGFLHPLREVLFLRQPDSDEIFCHRDRLSSAMRSLPDDVHPSPVGVLLPSLGGLRWHDLGRFMRNLWPRRQVAKPGQWPKRILRPAFAVAARCLSNFPTHLDHSTTDPAKVTLFPVP